MPDKVNKIEHFLIALVFLLMGTCGYLSYRLSKSKEDNKELLDKYNQCLYISNSLMFMYQKTDMCEGK